jgi:contact-dependent growth inhibition (CDI) system CdiI-like immunity protein
MFNLQFISEPYWSDERNELVLRGCITIGTFSEEFESSLSFWFQADYEQQWREAAHRIETGQIKSAFIVDMYDPGTTPFIMWWPVWRSDNTIFVHNELLLFKNLAVAFNATNPYVHIGERATENEDGNAISEWQVIVKDIEDFLTSRRATSV